MKNILESTSCLLCHKPLLTETYSLACSIKREHVWESHFRLYVGIQEAQIVIKEYMFWFNFINNTTKILIFGQALKDINILNFIFPINFDSPTQSLNRLKKIMSFI